MSVVSRVRVLVAAIGASLPLVLGVDPTAVAAEQAAAPGGAGVVAVAAPVSTGIAATPDAVVRYWTPQRMAHAVEFGSASQDGPSVQSPFNPWLSNTVGQLYFHNPATRSDQRCSASTVASGSGRLILSAARCLHGGAGGQFMQNVVFAPIRYNGDQPTPVYPAAGLLVLEEWAFQSSLRHDYAFVVLHETLVYLIGGNYLMFNGGSGWQANSLAYIGSPYYGQYGCPATTRYVNVFTDRRLEVYCPQHDIESVGGPWLRNFDTNTRIGYINGLNSQRMSSGYHRSPYFGSQLAALYEHADRCRPSCP